MGHQPQARYAALSGIGPVADAFGIELDDLFLPSGLDSADLAHPDRWIPAAAVAEVLERAASMSEQQNFGLHLAEHRRLGHLGPLAMVIREEPDLRAALQTLGRHNHMYNEALHMKVLETGDTATIRVAFQFGQPQPARQSVELATATLAVTLAELAGDRWRPLAVDFCHPAPTDTGLHEEVFHTQVRFGQECNGIVVRSTDLDAPNMLADPLLLSYARQLLDSQSSDTEIVRHTRELIELLLPAGRCTVDHVARSLGLSRRTLHRRLQAADTTFTDILDDTRRDLAQRLVSNPDNSLTDVSMLLMFSTPGNFTRWFTQRFGVAPRSWRQSLAGS
ncbi:MAG: AraC family transcriptional regulator [Mycobacterium sp.]